MIPHVLIRFLATQAASDSSAACPTISALHAIDLGSPRMVRLRWGFDIGLGSCLSHSTTLKVCLFDAKETSLRDLLRSGASDDVVMQTIGIAVRGKEEKHAGMEDIDVVANRPMILIGG